jgi:hypothetical protein
MKAQIRIGDEPVPMPVFTIGEPVVSVYDAERDDPVDPRPRILEWYRGIVVGLAYVRPVDERLFWKETGWVYYVRVVACSEGIGVDRWSREVEPFQETELKRSRYLSRAYECDCLTNA